MRAREFTLEAPLPPDWDPEKIDLTQTFRDRLAYVVDRAQRIGGGTARVALNIDYQGRPTVIKVAKNRKGLAQNQAEVSVYQTIKDQPDMQRLVVPLVDWDRENKPPVWIQTERARRIQAPTLVRLLQAPDWTTFLELVSHRINDRRLRNREGKLWGWIKSEQQIAKEFIEKGGTEQQWSVFSGYASDLADLIRMTTLSDYGFVGNWGRYQGRPVLLDLGFTDESKAAYGFLE